MQLRTLTNTLVSLFPILAFLTLTACGGGGGGGGGGSGGGGTPGPIPSGPSVAVHAGLIAACAGSGEVRVEWDLPESGFEAGLFHGPSSIGLVSGSPAILGLSGTGTTIGGLANGQQRFFAMGIRPAGSSTWTQAGEALRATPGAPIYVDAGAAAPGAGTLASPFTSLQAGVNAAAAAGGNVWVRNGSYAGPISVLPGTHVYGGFPTGVAFALANRNAQGLQTIVTTGSLQAAFFAAPPTGGGLSLRVVLDGLVCRGNNVGEWGVDTQKTDIDLRSLTISQFRGRGIRMVNNGTPVPLTLPTEVMNAQLVNCTSQQNGADGLSVLGAYNVHVDYCRFDANVQEGIELGPLVAINGFTSTFRLTASRCSNNGSEGVDASLAQPTGVTVGSATFDIDVVGCVFSGNSLDGLLIDEEHELAGGWRSNIVVRETTASNNALAGVHVDADGVGEVLLHRVRATANGGDGIFVSSETTGGHAVVSACWLAGNLGSGLDTSLGNKRVLASHCTFAGNQGGGFVCRAVEGAAANCIAHLQATPYTNVRQVGNAAVTNPAQAVFVNAPNAYAQVNTHTTGSLGLAAAAEFAAGATVELADDGTSFTAPQVNGATVVLDNVPTLRRLPASLMAFPGTSITDNATLAAGAVVAGLGMKETGAANVDPGPAGSPVGGAPGFADSIPRGVLWLDQVVPAAPTALANNSAVTLRFSSGVQSVSGTNVVVTNSTGGQVAAGVIASGNTITLNPPGGGWPAGALTATLHRSITSSDGGTIVPLIVPLR